MEGGRVEPLVDAGELLVRVRETGASDLASFADEIARAVSIEFEPGQSPQLGYTEKRARLLSYQEILTFDATGAVRAEAGGVPQATHQLHEIYAYSLRFDVAKALLALYMQRWPNASSLYAIYPILGSVNGPQDDFRDNKDMDVQIVEKPGATTTFVAVCGIRHAFGMHLNVLHHCRFAQHNVNVIYLRDFSQNLYLTGVESLGGVKKSCKRLRKHLERLNTRKLVMIGNSGGVFGALYYGAMLKADLALLFAGPSSLDIGLLETERQSYARLSQLYDDGVVEWPDIHAIYKQSDTPVIYYYGGQHRVDTMQAENLADLPSVQLRPIESARHFIMDELAKSGELDEVLAAAAVPKP